jgi:hypothetical protein
MEEFRRELGLPEVELLTGTDLDVLRAAFLYGDSITSSWAAAWTSRRGPTRCERCFGSATGPPSR